MNDPVGIIDPLGLQIVMHRLPPRVEAHNRWNDSWRQARREFQQDPLPFVVVPKYSCMNVCTESEYACTEPPRDGVPIPGQPGCYLVCTDGPVVRAAPAWSPVPPATNDPRQLGATANDWAYLFSLIRMKR